MYDSGRTPESHRFHYNRECTAIIQCNGVACHNFLQVHDYGSTLTRWHQWPPKPHNIKEVQGIQPRPFNRVCCTDVAARAGSVHLMYSGDRKLGQKGGARTTSSCTSILNKNLTDHRKSTNLITNTAQLPQHQNACNDVSPIPPHPQHNGTTH